MRILLYFLFILFLLMLYLSISYANEKINKCLKNKDCEFIVFGAAFPDQRMSFVVLETLWKKFSNKDKDDLRELLKTKIKDANNNPEKYIDIPRSAPVYNMTYNHIKNMESYSIMLSTKKNKRGLLLEKEIMINY